jgi:hypothetical protein
MNIKLAKIALIEDTKGNKLHEIIRIISHRKKSASQEYFRTYFHYLGRDMSFEYDEYINNEINK